MFPSVKLPTAVYLAGLLSACSAVTYDEASRLPANIKFDFVIVGGGAAGNVIANRLTENPHFEVLVIEGGPNNEGVLDSIVPGFGEDLPGSKFDWNFTTTPQNGAQGQILPYPRGRILGGSTSINSMIYTRGSSLDFDRFAKVTGDPGWSWNSLQPYIRRNEHWTPPIDNHNTTGQFNPFDHGFSGINAVTLPFTRPASAQRVMQTTQQLPDEFPFNLDMNGGNPLGVGWIQSTIKGGERSSSATSYLGPQYRSQPNLHVLVNTRVTRLLPVAGSGRSAFRTVEFTSSNSTTAALQHVTASKEVVLSAGTIGTPQIMLHSGIGDPADLSAVGIPTLVPLASVGKNFSDQPLVPLLWSTSSKDPLDNLFTNTTLLNEALTQWQTTRSGPLSAAGGSHLIFSRLPNDLPIFETTPDPASGPQSPHLEMFFAIGGENVVPISGPLIAAILFNVSPVSRGSVTVGSNNPFDNPIIDPNFLHAEYDTIALREAIKKARRFLAAPAWADFILSPLEGAANATTDAELDDLVRASLSPGLHGVGTSSMSPKNANYGVVDPDLLVKHTSGLRIVDASVMPFVTCAHTQAPTYIIAERAADLIKNAWK